MEALKKSTAFKGAEGPVVLVIMDGMGIGKYAEGDFVLSSNTPNLDWLMKNGVSTQLKAHGKAVGLPSDDLLGDQEQRGIMMEALTAACMLLAGGEVLIMRHPKAVNLTKSLINGLMS